MSAILKGEKSDDPYIGPKFVDGKPLYFDEVTYRKENGHEQQIIS
jgi:hypothetical protein